MRWLAIGLCLLASELVRAADPATVLVFLGVTVVDVEAGKLVPGRAVVITGAKITAVAAAEVFAPPPGATVVQAPGKYLIPGLWDMHVHHEFPWSGLLEVTLANGVTGVRDMNSEPFVLAWRKQIRDGKQVGPRIVVCGKRLDARLNGQPPRTVSADTAEEARELVQKRKTEGVDFIKVYSGLSPEVYRVIIEEAKAQKLPVAGHCPERVSALDASLLGQRSIEHLTGIAVSCSRGEVDLRKQLAAAFTGPHGYDIDATFPIVEAAMATPDGDKQASLFAAFKMHRTWQVPTLIAQRPLPGAKETPDPRLKYTHWALAQLWERIRAGDKHGKFREHCTAYARATVRAMHKAGVPLLAGTDAGGPTMLTCFRDTRWRTSWSCLSNAA